MKRKDSSQTAAVSLFDVAFLVGNGKKKVRLFGVRAILGVRSRVFQELLYGISTGFGSPQVSKKFYIRHIRKYVYIKLSLKQGGSFFCNFVKL